MKKQLLTILFALFLGATYSQTNFSSDESEFCEWNRVENTVTNCKTLKKPCLFFINAGETMITHTTTDMKSTYYVNEKRFIEETKTFIYSVTSDVGNNYVFAFDFNKSQVRLFMEGVEGGDFMIRYYVKATY